jgi:deoxyadenosine/deoxycytidine kinase
LDADKNIFAKMLHDDGMIEDIEYQIYQHFYKEYSAEFNLDGIVYIDAAADTCYNRVAKRSRDGESTISLEYLQKCKKYHDEWLLSPGTTADVFHIETSEDVKYDFTDKNDKGVAWLTAIEKYIHSHTKTFSAYTGQTHNQVVDMLEQMLGY